MKKLLSASLIIIQSCIAFAHNCGENDSTVREAPVPIITSTMQSPESKGNTHKHISRADSTGNKPLVLVNPHQNPYYLNGGSDGLLSDLYTTMSKTAPITGDSIKGRAVVSFVISKDGFINPNSIKICRNRSVPEDYMEAAIEAIKSLGQFEPGKLDGEPKNVTWNQPVFYPIPSKYVKTSE